LPLRQVTVYGARVHASGEHMEGLLGSVREELSKHGVGRTRLEIVEPSLEDVFIECMQD
jgi:hypothetical protein